MEAEEIVHVLRAEASDMHRTADHLDLQSGTANAVAAIVQREVAYTLQRLANRFERS